MTKIQNEIIEIIDKLSKNAMFRLSLCSKELFHSNFWAWLIEQNPKFISIFGKEFLNIENIDVKREEKICTVKHEDIFTENKFYKKTCIADMSFIFDNNLYIIENKLKSLPNKEQLDDYLMGDIINDKYTILQRKVILTSFTKPVFKTDNNIKFISYKEICLNLKSLKYLFDNDNGNKIILENYIEYLELMNKLNESLSLKNSSLTYGELLDKINNTNLQEKVEKLHFDTFIKNLMYCHLVTDILENTKYENLFTCVTYSSREKHAYMDIMIPIHDRTLKEISEYRRKGKKDFETFYAGIQIADEEYRKYFNVIKKIKQKNNETKNALTKNLYEDFSTYINETNDDSLNCNRVNNNGFYCYDYEEDAWLYRKTNVDIKSLTFEKLKERIIKDLNYLKNKSDKY